MKTETTFLVTAGITTPLNGQAAASIMYIPAGKSKIRASVNGEPKSITVNACQANVPLLQSALATIQAGAIRPFLDFDHDEKIASAIPQAFRWQEDGIYLDVEWTASGKKAIEGRDYSYFSPSFRVNAAGQPVDLPDEGSLGALTNRPAFRSMKRIAAAQNKSGGNTQQQKEHMDELTQELVSLGFITASQASDPDSIRAGLKAYAGDARKTKESAELTSLKAELAVAKAETESIRAAAVDAEADLIVKAAVDAGKILPKDIKAQTAWKTFIKANKESAKDLLESLPVNPALKPVVNVTAGQARNTATTGDSNKGAQCNALVAEVRAANPGMSFEDAWNVAATRHPETFASVKA